MFGLYSKSFQEIISILEKHPNIDKVVIYGSRAKGNYKEGSDVDLTLFGELEYNAIRKLKHELEDSNIPYLFDISLYDNLKSESLKEHIDRVGQIFYKKAD